MIRRVARDLSWRAQFGTLQAMLDARVIFSAFRRRARVAAMCGALVLLGLGSMLGAQPTPKQPTDLPPCPVNTPPDPKKPCAPVKVGGTSTVRGGAGVGVASGDSGAGAGGGGGAGGGDGGGAGGGESEDSGPIGPYTVVKVMDVGGATPSGFVCSIERPFTVHMDTPKVSFNIGFAPAGKTRGTWTYAYSIPSAGESHDAIGSHTITPAGADGTRSLSINGKDHVVFHGFDGPMPMSYTMKLVPVTGPSPCGV
jgi:hypothetical protein